MGDQPGFPGTLDLPEAGCLPGTALGGACVEEPQISGEQGHWGPGEHAQ